MKINKEVTEYLLANAPKINLKKCSEPETGASEIYHAIMCMDTLKKTLPYWLDKAERKVYEDDAGHKKLIHYFELAITALERQGKEPCEYCDETYYVKRMKVLRPIMAPLTREQEHEQQNPNVLFVDNREFNGTANDGRNFVVKPDILCSFTELPFPDKSFKHVVFDPPQMLYAGSGGQMALHYTVLPRDWQPLIRDEFAECWRVLDDYGTLIFKWSAHDIPVKKVIEAIGHEPLYGHKSGRASKTHWMAFMKNESK